MDATDSISRWTWAHGKALLNRPLMRGTWTKRQDLRSFKAPFRSALRPLTPWQGGPAPSRTTDAWQKVKLHLDNPNLYLGHRSYKRHMLLPFVEIVPFVGAKLGSHKNLRAQSKRCCSTDMHIAFWLHRFHVLHVECVKTHWNLKHERVVSTLPLLNTCQPQKKTCISGLKHEDGHFICANGFVCVWIFDICG